jgi:hypothetical protein
MNTIEELEGYVWTYSPAMAQAKIDELNEELDRMRTARDGGKLRP